ncbi:hypothetical protein DXC69_03805 [Paenibacillus polymyxa]|nr:hypothetical protein DXC69_03805 [Paenibacillus polymyxa]
MSRPIKFRAWNKQKNIMCYDNEDDSADCWDGVFASDVSLINAYLGMSNEYEYMQYTGLKDRNGKEIYEGDILAWQDHKHLWSTADDSFTAKATVKFDLVELKYTVGHLSLSAKREFEVIGNIYETPLEDTP